MIPDYYVEYNGKRYPVFLINILDQTTEESAENMEFIEVPVSVESLSRQLIDSDSGSPVSPEATSIDEEISFYIPDYLADKEATEIADFVSDNYW